MKEPEKFVFATHNTHKRDEILHLVDGDLQILDLNDIGCFSEIPEIGQTLEENAMIKAQFVYEKYGMNCFADDTGLEVEVLNQAPGVYSARYAGEEKSAVANMTKLLHELDGQINRKARFRTVIVLVENGTFHSFEGIVNGEILTLPLGEEGFGYDPVFQPAGYVCSFAQMSMEEKNRISHRAKAFEKLLNHLNATK